MWVRTRMSDGRSSSPRASPIACSIAPRSFPSSTVLVCQPYAAKRLARLRVLGERRLLHVERVRVEREVLVPRVGELLRAEQRADGGGRDADRRLGASGAAVDIVERLRARDVRHLVVEALDLGEYGDFFLAGGFPGINERIHAVADEKDDRLVRVIIDEYPSLEAAEQAEKNLRARGVIGIVKELPRGEALDAYVSSNGV